MRVFLFTAALALLSIPSFADGVADSGEPEKTERLDSVIVSVSRAGSRTPVTFTMMGKESLRASNPMNSLPMALNLQPSVVSYNDNGTGLGNSAMTIRGSKGSQINVTLNGITLNDAESQEVFWVNIPALHSLISSVQVQRGLGTTASGPGAFGASINMNTASVGPDPFASAEISRGSWNTLMTTVSAGTGLTSSGLYANVAYAKGFTDGYIRNGKVDSQSLFAVLGWLKGNNSLRLTYLMGDQTSGITWNGIDIDQYNKDRRYNDAGEYYDEYGNVHYYDNAVDSYKQHHIQLNYTHSFSDRLTWTTTLNYTRGDGYDEYYKEDKKLNNYGFSYDGGNPKSDIIYRKEMANDFYVANTDLRYDSGSFRLTAGASASKYSGDHFGTVLWAALPGDEFDYSSLGQGNVSTNSWYWNVGDKKDVSVFVRSEKDLADLVTIYADLQYRHVGLDMRGADDDAVDITYQDKWDFFNPRFGAKFYLGERHNAFASYAYGNREPGRGDIKENVKGALSPIRPEKMHDIELGYEYRAPRLTLNANIYFMEYRDMLLETGNLSSSGYAIKENVPQGYRRGLELAAAWNALRWLDIDGNLTLSRNRIKDYVSYVSVDDSKVPAVKAFEYGDTDMLLSPSVTGMARISVAPWKGVVSNSLRSTTLSLDWKYVGHQYIDNSSRKEMEIPAYNVLNLTVSHEFDLGGGKLGLSAYVNNLLNRMYYAYGWRWESYSQAEDALYSGIGVYPQAPANFMFKLSYRF